MTAHAPIPLFRQEVLAARKDRLQGDVCIAVPLSWQIIGYLLFAALAVALVFLTSATYSRVETVNGAIVVDKGVAPIIPTRAGVIVDLPVKDGEQVAVGQILARVRSEEDQASGGTASERMIESLNQQDRQLGTQASLLLGSAGAERMRLQATISGANQEIASVDQQIADQQKLVTLAENDYRQVQSIADKGFISRRDLESRESTLLARRQQLSQLQQARAAKTSIMVDAQRAITQSLTSAQAQAAAVQSQRTQLAQQMAQADAAKGYSLTSPIAGTVTALTARLGQPAAQDQQLMIVVPDGGRARVELYVPTSAAGFLKTGQDVSLAVDAFPYERFGTVAARISDISSIAITKQMSAGPVPVYLVTAELVQPSVEAFGTRQPLLPGMALTARIVTRRQSLFEWLFEPVFAVRRR